MPLADSAVFRGTTRRIGACPGTEHEFVRDDTEAAQAFLVGWPGGIGFPEGLSRLSLVFLDQ